MIEWFRLGNVHVYLIEPLVTDSFILHFHEQLNLMFLSVSCTHSMFSRAVVTLSLMYTLAGLTLWAKS